MRHNATSAETFRKDAAVGRIELLWCWLRPRLRSHRVQFALTLRTTVAAVVGLAVAQALSLPLPLWTVLTALIAFPYFAVLSHRSAVLIFVGVVVSLLVHAMQYGPQAALIGESFPTHLRYGGAGLGYQLASVFAGGPAPLIATWLLHETGTPYSISIYIVLAAIITIGCVAALPDRSRVDIEDAAVYRGASDPRL